MSVRARILLLVWFHVGWLGCVYFAQRQWFAASLIFPLAGWVLLMALSRVSAALALRLLVFALVGMAFDAAAGALGWISFTTDFPGPLPLWLVALWLLYVAVLPLFGDGFRGRWPAAALLGLIFGPLSYFSGGAFGVLHLNGVLAITIYALFWAAFFPLTLYYQRKLL